MGLDWGAADRSHTLMLPSPLQDTRMFSLSCRYHMRRLPSNNCESAPDWGCAARMERAAKAAPRKRHDNAGPAMLIAAGEHTPCYIDPCMLPQNRQSPGTSNTSAARSRAGEGCANLTPGTVVQAISGVERHHLLQALLGSLQQSRRV